MTKVNTDKRIFCPICRKYSMQIFEFGIKTSNDEEITTASCYCLSCDTDMTLKTSGDITRAQYSGVQTKIDSYGGSE